MTLRRAAVALCIGALALLPGCGSSDKGKPIPAATSDKLIQNIQAADTYSQQGRCDRAHTKVRDARFVLTQVPDSVDTAVRQGIADGLQHLDGLITSECQPPTQTTQTQTTPTTTTPTTTTPSTTTPTTTTPTTTTPTTTTPTSTTPTTTTPTGTGTGTGTGTSTGNGGTPTSTGATGTGTGGTG